MVGESLERTLGRIEGKLDAVLGEQALEPERRAAIYQRLSIVEKWQVRFIAVGTAVIALIGIGYKVLLDIARLTGHN